VQLEHRFTVPADVDTVWTAMLDPEKVAPCMPGATLTGVDGTTFTGMVKVKLGPISLLYKGSGEFLETDQQARRVVIKASGKDSRGNGTASATVTVTLTPGDATTTGQVITDLAITGKPAQFGRGLITEVGGKILDVFAACLAHRLAPAAVADSVADGDVERSWPVADKDSAGSPPGAAGGAARPQADPASTITDEPRPEIPAQAGPTRALHAVPDSLSEPIDLLEFARPSLRKRLLPVIAGVALAVLVVVLRRRR
jgi:carbon monoxide dehydrogenase subunit G